MHAQKNFCLTKNPAIQDTCALQLSEAPGNPAACVQRKKHRHVKHEHGHESKKEKNPKILRERDPCNRPGPHPLEMPKCFAA